MSLLTSLQAYYKLSTDGTDSSGNIFTLTNNNTVAFNTGFIGNGADFSSTNTNKSLSTTSLQGLTVNEARTYSCWFNVTTLPTGGALVSFLSSGYNANNVGYTLQIEESSGSYILITGRYRNGTANPVLSPTISPNLTTGVWHLLVYTFDGTNTEIIYYDGTSIANSAGTTNTGNGASGGVADGFALGNLWQTSPLRFFSGKVDEVGVWSRALSSGEVTSLYNGGVGNQYPFSVAGHNLSTLGVGV